MEIPGDGFIRKWLEGKHSSTPPCRASALAPPASRPRASKPKRNRFMDDALDLTTSYQCEPVILGSQVAVGWTGPLSSGGLDCVDCWGLRVVSGHGLRRAQASVVKSVRTTGSRELGGTLRWSNRTVDPVLPPK